MGHLQTRYIRVEHTSLAPTTLSLAEVVVYESGKNVARRGRASQIGTDYDGRPELAIDGNHNGIYDAHSTTHSNYIPRPWWELDLIQNTQVERIEIWNREDGGFGHRLSGARVVLLDADRKVLWVHILDNPEVCTQLDVPAQGALFSQADCQQFQLYLADRPGYESMLDTEYVFELVAGGKFFGTITSWKLDEITIEVRFTEDTFEMRVPPNLLQAIWSKEVATGAISVPRDQEHSDTDNIYTMATPGKFHRTLGRVRKLEGSSVLYESNGALHKQAWAPTVGIVFRQSPASRNHISYELVDFKNGQQLMGRLQSLSENTLKFETMWGQTLVLPRRHFLRLTTNHRAVPPPSFNRPAVWFTLMGIGLVGLIALFRRSRNTPPPNAS